MEDEECVRRYLKGDTQAFQTLYARYADRLYSYFYRSCGSGEAAEELFQNLWLKVLISLGAYRERGQFRSWLFVCAHNVIVDQHRRKTLPIADAEEIDALATRQVMPDTGLADRIEQAVNTLPMEQRQAFYLREELGCPLREIAEIQGCSLEAAKSRLRYAYTRLREALNELKAS